MALIGGPVLTPTDPIVLREIVRESHMPRWVGIWLSTLITVLLKARMSWPAQIFIC
jgi:hypothetical protein